MTAAQQVRRAQAVLAVSTALVALAWGACGGAAVLVVAGAADLWIGLGRTVRTVIPAAAYVAGIVVLGASLWRYRRVLSPQAVALWIEERRPELGFALVTALDPSISRRPVLPSVDFVGTALARGLRAIGPPALTLVLSIAALGALPEPVMRRVVTAKPGDVLDRPRAEASPLADIVTTVEPPAYTGLPPFVQENPTVVRALVGSAVIVEGIGPASDVVALSRASGGDGQRVPVAAAGHRWKAAFVMPVSAVVLDLAAAGSRRAIAFDPVPDSIPTVRLVSPGRDSVLREGRGEVELHAEARDDFGLESLWFELIVSSGEGESYAFRSSILGRRAMREEKSGVARITLALDSLGLGPGDVVHLRAVARDGNIVSGPGVGVSETRAFRVARAGEYDTTAVVTLPPIEPDTSVLSQRMLIMLAEALVPRRAELGREAFVRESEAIGRDQTRLRRRVGEIVFMRLGAEDAEHGHGTTPENLRAEMTPAELLAAAEAAAEGAAGEALDFHGDETPVVAINRPLLEAYNAMWDASRELNVGAPGRALPHMYAALEAIQRARAAERIYLRGRPPSVVVDVARVRLQGKRDDARPAAEPVSVGRPERSVSSRVERVITLTIVADPGAADSALLLRADVLADHATLAAALAEVAAALRSGGDATTPLLRARRATERPVRARGTLTPWGVGW